MSEQSSTAANTPSEPQLCRMGCGFFGSNATGDCCSKCWRDLQKQKGKPSEGQFLKVDSSVSSVMNIDVPKIDKALDSCEVSSISPMKTEDTSPEKKPIRKNSKTSYKSMMASIKQGNKTLSDIEQEKESLRNVTGGGSFSKIDRI